MKFEKRGVKTTVEIPEALLKAAKQRSAQEPGGLRGVLVRALEDYVGKASPYEFARRKAKR